MKQGYHWYTLRETCNHKKSLKNVNSLPFSCMLRSSRSTAVCVLYCHAITQKLKVVNLLTISLYDQFSQDKHRVFSNT